LRTYTLFNAGVKELSRIFISAKKEPLLKIRYTDPQELELQRDNKRTTPQ